MFGSKFGQPQQPDPSTMQGMMIDPNQQQMIVDDGRRSPFDSVYMPPDKSNLHRFMLDNTDILAGIEHALRGQVYDEKTGEFKQVYTPLLNDDAVNKLMAHIAPRFNQNIILSFLSEAEIKVIAGESNQAVIDFLVLCFSDLKIKKSDLTTIRMIVDHNIFTMLKRAENGKALNAITTTARHIETYRDDQGMDQKKSGLMGSVMGMFK